MGICIWCCVLGFRSDPEAEFATSVSTWQGLFLMGFD